MIDHVVARLFRPTPRTEWIFVSVTDAAGHIGLGECSMPNASRDVLAHLERRFAGLRGKRVSSDLLLSDAPEPRSLAEAAAAAGLNQALHDLLARREGIALAGLLGGQKRDAIHLYANINRQIVERTPENFAAAARDAVEQGALAIKIAPFDDVTPRKAQLGEADVAILLGFERIAAVREAIGTRPLMVDCHWRFDIRTAHDVIEAASRFDLHWIECPIAETPETLDDLRALRQRANALNIRLAGGEHAWRREQIDAFLAAEAYDVLMPDVKYTASLSAFLEMARAVLAAGVELSPHNPTGPVAHAMSIEVSSVLEHQGLLEYQHGETPFFDSIVDHRLPPVVAGVVKPDPERRGIGLSLNLPQPEFPQARDARH